MALLTLAITASWAIVRSYPWPLVVFLAMIAFPFVLVAIKQIAPQRSDQPSTQVPLAKSSKLSPVIEICSSDDLKFRIEAKSINGTNVLMVIFTNGRDDNLEHCRLEVREASSFNSRKSTFRQSVDFRRTPVINLLPERRHPSADLIRIDAGHKAKPEFLVRDVKGKLYLGNDDQHFLDWPPDDTSEDEVWRFRLCAKAQIARKDPFAELRGVGCEFKIEIKWSRRPNIFLLRRLDG